MADKYVSSLASGAGDGSSESSPWTLTQAFSTAVVGDYVWLLNDGTYTNTYTVTASGSYAANTHIYFIGYNDLNNCDVANHISDMDIGQPYWGGPLNPSFANGWCDIDGGGAATRLLYANAKHNLHFRNLYFHNVASGQTTVRIDNCKSTTFTKCKFESLGAAWAFYDTAPSHTKIMYCYFGGDYGSYSSTASGFQGIFSYNFFTCNILNCNMGTGTFEHNIVINGQQGLNCFVNGTYVNNNIFYNQSIHCIGYGHSSLYGYLSEHSNIFMPADKGDILINKSGNGSLVYSGYSCAWALSGGGEPMTSAYAGEHGLNVDPLLVDPANNDFRLKPASPCINTGKPTIGTSGDNGYSFMGAWQKKYRFAAGGRMTNRARLQIIR